MKDAAYTLQCYKNPNHEIPVVLRFDKNETDTSPHQINVQCPICDARNTVTINQPFNPDMSVLRGVKQL